MRWLLRTVVGVVSIVAVMASVGWMLPVNHEASRSAEVAAGPEAAYALVSDVRAYPTWWPDITGVDVLSDDPGRLRFREHLSMGPVVMVVVEAVPSSRFTTRIDDPDQPFGGTWTIEIEPSRSGGGSRITVTERGEVYNPIFRFLSRFVFGYTQTMESFLRAAAARLVQGRVH